MIAKTEAFIALWACLILSSNASGYYEYIFWFACACIWLAFYCIEVFRSKKGGE